VRRFLRSPHAAAIFSLFLFAAATSRADTIFLHDPAPRLCLTGPDAQYSLDGGLLVPERGMFSLYERGENPLEPRVIIPAAAQPGDLLRLHLLTLEPVDSVSVEVVGPGARTLSRGAGFRARASEQGEWWDVLIGIPANAPVKEVTISLRAMAGKRSCLFLLPLDILEREFLSERIPFNKDLTRLVTVPDPRKAAEYQALLRLLRTPHPDAQYETGPLLVPLPTARRTSNYGDRRQYLLTNDDTELSIHQGVDLAAPTGSLVPASGRGRVVFAGPRVMTGKSVIIEHMPGLFSLYFHLSEIRVAEGDIVEQGQVLGEVGMTGLATGPHLHWEVDAFTTAVDPDAVAARPLLDTEPDF
jgi:hypothetical protein